MTEMTIGQRVKVCRRGYAADHLGNAYEHHTGTFTGVIEATFTPLSSGPTPVIVRAEDDPALTVYCWDIDCKPLVEEKGDN